MPTPPAPEPETRPTARPTAAVGVAAALILAVAQAVVSPRPAAPAGAAAPERLPMEIGTWQGRDAPADPKELARAGIEGFVSRRYADSATGAEVLVFLAWGPGGPLSVHTPDRCFGASGYALESPPTTVRLPAGRGGEATFFRGRFRLRDGALPEGLELFWSWKHEGAWLAPDRPRSAFAGAARLAKIYVARPLGGRAEGGPTGPDPCRDFLAAWLAEAPTGGTPPRTAPQR